MLNGTVRGSAPSLGSEHISWAMAAAPHARASILRLCIDCSKGLINISPKTLLWMFSRRRFNRLIFSAYKVLVTNQKRVLKRLHGTLFRILMSRNFLKHTNFRTSSQNTAIVPIESTVFRFSAGSITDGATTIILCLPAARTATFRNSFCPLRPRQLPCCLCYYVDT